MEETTGRHEKMPPSQDGGAFASPTSPLAPPSFWILCAGLALLVIISWWMGWVGHLGSDDVAYIDAARGWFEDFPYLPPSHWAVRHTLNIPMGILFQVFGESEFLTTLPSLLYALGLLAMLYGFLRRRTEGGTAFLAAAVVALLPLFTQLISTANVDVVELFYVFASFLCFASAWGSRDDWRLLLLSGILAGLAVLSRETAAALVVFYGLMFLFRPGMPRWMYFVMGGGFCLVIGAEMLYYVLLVGDPLYRYPIVLGHAGDTTVSMPGTGNITTNRWLGPIASVLVNDEFGLLFWLAPVAAWFGLRGRRLPGAGGGRFLGLLCVMGAVWFIVDGYCLGLRPLPRYFTVPAIVVAIVFGCALSALFANGRAVLGGLLLAFFVATNLTLVDLSNQQHMLPERTAVRVLEAEEGGTLHTDPRTAFRSQLFLEWADIDPGNLVAEMPGRGDIYLYSPGSVSLLGSGKYAGIKPDDYRPRPSWEAVETVSGHPTVIGHVLMVLGLDSVVENAGLSRLIWETEPVEMYRVR